MPNIEDVLLLSLTQKGKKYIFGAEAKATDPSPKAFDCSELVEWSCDRAGVVPKMPDGAFNQWRHCSPIPVKQGLTTRGALLFVGDGTGSGRNAVTHVAWSLGDGTTIEARGSKWGVGTWPSVNRFDFAGLVPGVDYTHRAPLPPAPPIQEDDMPAPMFQLIKPKDGVDGGKVFLVSAAGHDYVTSDAYSEDHRFFGDVEEINAVAWDEIKQLHATIAAASVAAAQAAIIEEMNDEYQRTSATLGEIRNAVKP